MIDALVNALQFAGNVVDTPGSILRALLAGEGERSLTGILDPEQRVSGRDMLQNWGVVGENQEGLDGGDIAGFGAELLTDPLNLLGIGLLGKTSKAAGVANAMNKERSLIEALNAESMAMRAAGAMPEEIAALTKIVDDAGNPKRMLHGTARPFEGPYDINRLDSDALFGRGIYTTDNADVAGGIVSATEPSRRPGGSPFGGYVIEKPGYAMKAPRSSMEDAANYWESNLGNVVPSYGGGHQKVLEIIRNPDGAFDQVKVIKTDPSGIPLPGEQPFTNMGLSAPEPTPIPNVKMHYVDARNPFNMDSMMTQDQAVDILLKAGHPEFVAENLGREFPSESFFKILGDTPDQSRQIIAKAGFDSIIHQGGGRVGNIPHNVAIAFDPKQIYNPYIAPALKNVPDLQNAPSMSPIIAALMAQNTLRPMHGGY